jgi:mannose-1-phosphate guanylyltransferase
MKFVLLSGGSGKRLWPLSNDSRAKQFLKVLQNERDLQLKSMVQRVWGQLETIGMKESSVIATGKGQVEMIHSQLGEDVPIIIEPERRDTFPAIALAAAYLYSVQGASFDEVVGVLPVDPFVETTFFQRVNDLEEILKKTNADLALLGVKPTYPSSKYGYIVPKDTNDGYINVSHFKEKPDEKTAEALMAKDALWNCGVFAFKLGHIINLLEDKGLPINYEALRKQYSSLEKTSFDYEVVEKTDKIVALSYDGFWKDLGTWNTLTEEMATNQIGKGVISENTVNTHLINELDIPVTVLGVSNAIVAVSPDGILVSDKEQSPKIKELISGFDDRPMYEERRWGWYRVLDFTKYDEDLEVLTRRIGILAGKNLSYQYHVNRTENWTILKGEGILAINGRLRTIKAGDILQINPSDKHALKAITDLEFIEVQNGTELIEEDIIRIHFDWVEIENHCYNLTN